MEIAMRNIFLSCILCEWKQQAGIIVVVEYMRCIDILEPYTMEETFSAITEIIKIFANLVAALFRNNTTMVFRRKVCAVCLFKQIIAHFECHYE